MSIISNVYEEISYGEKKQCIEILRELKDDVQNFNEIECGSVNSLMGRYCSSETIKVYESSLKKRYINY